MSMQYAIYCPSHLGVSIAPLLRKRVICSPSSSRRKGSLHPRTWPTRDLLIRRSSEHRQQSQDAKVEEESKTTVRQEFAWDFDWLPAFPHVLTASMANFMFGYHIGVMNGPIEAIGKELGFDKSPFLEGLVVSIFIVGAFIGSISSSSLNERLGCRRTLQIVSVPLIIGPLLSAQANSLNEMLLGRFLVGLGIGVNTVLVPIYISEVSPTRYRGFLGSLCQIGTCLGIITSLSLALHSESDLHGWRSLLIIASAPGLLLMLGMQYAVESPRWLCKVGRLADAESVIYKLWGEADVNNSIKEIQSVTKSELDSLKTWFDLLVDPHKKAAFIGGGLFMLQQFSGINGVLYFSSLTFSDVGITNASMASLYVGITNFAGALVAMYLMDKQGRKKLLVGSYLGMGLSMLIVALAVISPIDEDLSHMLSIFGTLTYIFTFALGAGPVTGLVIPELSSAQMRSKIMGFSLAIHWICNFLVGLFFLEIVEKVGVGAVYGAFGAVSIGSAIFAAYFIVETKGRSLEEIEMSLNPSMQTKGK